jgi:hypothetical protein
VIKIGCFTMPRLRKRTLAYTRVRRSPRVRKSRPAIELACDPRIMFGPAEFPTATLHKRAARYLLADWMRARWSWVRPRTIPLAVAFAGMIAVLASVHYLSAPRGWSTAVIQLDREGSTHDPRVTVDVKPMVGSRSAITLMP